MKPLGLTFTLNDLAEGPRPFEGLIDQPKVADRIGGLVGDLGYRAAAPAKIEGMAYLAQREVVVDVQITAAADFDCVRCLTTRTLDVGERLHIVIAPEPEGGVPDLPEDELLMEDGVEDSDMAYYKGEEIKLEDLLLEYVVLEMPMNPSCDTVGLDDQCVSEGLKALENQETIDPRWAPLAAMKAAMEAGETKDED